ncbi:MAG: hypothetical protein ACWGHO_04550 [Candidatus Moraniibacteriota bacterium]
MKNNNKEIIMTGIMELQDINNAENNNLEESIKKFPKEVYFYNELAKAFSTSSKAIPVEYTIIITLFQLCSHNLAFSFMNLLRVHFTESCMINRKSIEAVGQATIIAENIDMNSRIWFNGENGINEGNLFKSVFKKNKFRSCKNKDELTRYYKMFCLFNHANIAALMHKQKKGGNKIVFGYFDSEVDDVDAWMMEYLNYTLWAYILILEEFSNIFGDKIEISKERIGELKNEHMRYAEAKFEAIEPI